jgi:hypothetical protein
MLDGVLVGEGFYGWSTLADTTDWRCWVTELVIGALVVSPTAARPVASSHNFETPSPGRTHAPYGSGSRHEDHRAGTWPQLPDREPRRALRT